MIRFASQPYRYSCGPTAIINSLKWAGLKTPIKRFHKAVAILCSANYEMGTDELDFERVLRKLGKKSFTVRKRLRPTIKMITDHVKQGHAAVLLYWRPGKGYLLDKGDIEGHYTLVFDVYCKEILCANDRQGEAVSFLDRNSFKKKVTFRRYSRTIFPVVWLLKKK